MVFNGVDGLWWCDWVPVVWQILCTHALVDAWTHCPGRVVAARGNRRTHARQLPRMRAPIVVRAYGSWRAWPVGAQGMAVTAATRCRNVPNDGWKGCWGDGVGALRPTLHAVVARRQGLRGYGSGYWAARSYCAMSHWFCSSMVIWLLSSSTASGAFFSGDTSRWVSM